MPGDNCAVFGCGSSRRTKGIGIWKLPAPRNDEYKKWREDWLNELTKTRQIDENFESQIGSDRVYTCERHFAITKPFRLDQMSINSTLFLHFLTHPFFPFVVL